MAYCRWWTLNYGKQWAEKQSVWENTKRDASSTIAVMRLPTEAEWEFAARGLKGREYPWGNTEPSPKQAIHNTSEPKQTSTVGSYPQGATPEGVFDLAGNVWEWCYDWYDGYKPNSGKDPLGPNDDANRVLRGGSWNNNDRAYFRCANRSNFKPDYRYRSHGFRITRTL